MFFCIDDYKYKTTHRYMTLMQIGEEYRCFSNWKHLTQTIQGSNVLNVKQVSLQMKAWAKKQHIISITQAEAIASE